ncbi:VWA-like domain-containing protein [Anaerobutyricum hallii]|nr:VWA-like domain-containing protein [Anaerobutyricum hallii]
MTQTEWENEMCIKILELIQNELYVDFRYLDVAVSALTLTPNDSLRSTATDGISFFSRQNRFFGYSAPTRFFLNRAVLHSVFHCIFRHLWIRGSRDPDLWNLSCDIAVEWIIDSFEKKSVKRALSGIRTNIYNDFRQYKIPITAANIYRYLLPDIADNPDRLNQLMMEFFTDDHRFWPKKPSTSPSAAKAGQSWDKISRRMEQELNLRGDDSASGIDAMKTQIKEGKSRRSYKDFLRKFTVLKEELHCDYDEFDLNYYSYGLRLYKNMPLIEPLESREVTKISEFVIVIDTSYSTNGPLVQKFLEETFQIIQERDSFFHKSQIRIIQCDNQVHSDTIIKEQRDIPKLLHNFELIGGGGTDFRPAFSYINKLLENGEFQNLKGVLYFTDGKGIYPAKRPPYETAFLFLGEEEHPDVPAWAMKLILHEEDL